MKCIDTLSDPFGIIEPIDADHEIAATKACLCTRNQRVVRRVACHALEFRCINADGKGTAAEHSAICAAKIVAQ